MLQVVAEMYQRPGTLSYCPVCSHGGSLEVSGSAVFRRIRSKIRIFRIRTVFETGPDRPETRSGRPLGSPGRSLAVSISSARGADLGGRFLRAVQAPGADGDAVLGV